MTTAQHIRELLGKSLKASLGLFLYSFGVHLTVKASIGLAPWDVFAMGLSNHLPLTFGQATIMISVLIVIIDILLKEQIGLGTILDAIIVGVGGYVLSFLLAWALANLTKWPRTILALILYSPSMTAGVAMSVLWKIMFTGDQTGYINSWLMEIGIINEPIIWLTNGTYLLPIVIIIGLWSSMGVGFLSILAGLLNVDESLYEAAAIDGVKNRFQEMIYITIPSMKPQMLFAAVMQIVGAFQNGAVSTMLAGNPTPGYAAQLIVNHIEDYGFIRYEMGYAAAVSVVLLLIVQIFSKLSTKLFGEND